ncbi:SspB family protein [Ancylobacter defluvii]|uniref:Stringent starvation protein B n=1 Tax=Ancylobacter defluvii TaxID=1282440 RepID=A0A9W6JS17_9HYPH|nr:ClpXP protease specificity-enhancing factor SspB [Ancylobacter defluvii]MBS7587532.1 hypothetical protein [Ancylobacter defluvii]GLK82222.1 hypothetical protein GCM10017653_02910 [Ancylobacter defluvii]
MSVDLIRYDLLVQEALRAVVRRVLTDVARDGLPGDHHLYVSFDTCAPGVRLSPRLKDKYPEEMTIVLQHQFWDLVVTELFFEVGLSFNGIPERLHVPFDALKGFFDPSVKFGLQFEPPPSEEGDSETGTPGATTGGAEVASLADARPAAREPAKGPVPVAARPQPRPAPAAASDTAKDKPAAAAAPKAVTGSGVPKSGVAKSDAAKSGDGKSSEGKGGAKSEPAKAGAGKSEAGKSEAGKPDEAKEGGAQVVRLDAFRKK